MSAEILEHAAFAAYSASRRAGLDYQEALRSAVDLYSAQAVAIGEILPANVSKHVEDIIRAQAQFDLFGDESHSGTHTVYATIGFETDLIDRACYFLDGIKKDFGASQGQELHAAAMMNSHKRNKSGWGYLDEAGVIQLFVKIAYVFSRMSGFKSAAVADRRGYPKKYSLEIGPNKSSFNFAEKQAAVFCLGISVGGLDKKKIRNFYVDQEKTKIDWFETRRQTETLYQTTWKDISPPKPLTSKEQPLLEVADLLAYACMRAVSTTRLSQTDRAFGFIADIFGARKNVFSLHHDGKMYPEIPPEFKDQLPKL